MKKYFILLLVSILTLTSCDLTRDPKDFGAPNFYFDTQEKLESVLAGVYDRLGDRYLYGYTMPYRLGFECDEGFYGRLIYSGPQVFNFEAGHPDIYNFWVGLYTGIDRANNLLYYTSEENLVAEKMDSIQLGRIRGEALFLRAYYYFMLVQNFGDVPLVLTPTTDPEAIDIPRSSIKDVYERITKDMIEAEVLVSDIRTLNFSGRVSKSAVRGILARVYLSMAGEPLKDVSKYEDTKLWALKVIEDKESNHSLNPSYSQVFINYAQDKYDINESIWEVEFRGNNTDAYNEGGVIGYVNGPYSQSNDAGQGWGGVRVTYKLFDSYKFGDVRREWNIACYNIDQNGNSVWFTGPTPAIIYGRYTGKFRREYETLLPKAVSLTPLNFPLLRYSDVLLMFAEADNELNGGPTPASIDAVNQVRLRAVSTGIKSLNLIDGGSGYTSAPVVEVEGGNQENLSIKAIVAGSKVVRLLFDNNRVFREARGEGFSVPPTIKFISKEGSGATATAELFDKEEFKLSNEEIASQQDFRLAIQNERYKELCFELLRKGDLIRWGNLIKEMKDVEAHLNQFAVKNDKDMANGYKNIWEKYLLWPIPTKELTVNKALIQNPYW